MYFKQQMKKKTDRKKRQEQDKKGTLQDISRKS